MKTSFLEFFNLHQGEEDKQKVLQDVFSSVSFRGSNLWILVCAIIIASVGLNVNSTAVIIGAMLISPLMGPIVGAGFALGTFDLVLLKKSAKNLAIATVVSLIVSSLYFSVSPFKDVQSELLARTSPNIYDVMIAFFGGLVGVIAITRVEKGNPIPGVAIATALMPPLCTAGYGIATLNASYFAGAFYLYTINCFFICISTYAVVKYLKYPPVDFTGKRFEKKIRVGITLLVLVMIVPSSYLAYRLWNEKKFTKTVDNFINSELSGKGYIVIHKRINYNSNPKKVELALLSKVMNEEEIRQYNQILNEMGDQDISLTFRQNDGDLKSEIMSELNRSETILSEKDIVIGNLKNELSNYRVEDASFVKELKILFPDINKVSVGKLEEYVNADSTRFQTALIYQSQRKIDQNKLKSWLKERLKTDNVILISE
jgi:uncharacterized hydrophobic protein (TIGR00271 family)